MKQYKLKDITELITCGVAKRPEYTKEGIMFLSSQNVKADKIILDKYNYISIYDYERLTKINKPEKGDILYTRVGSFGEAAVVDIDDKFALYVSLTLIKPKKELVNNRYLMHFLNSPKVKEFAKNNTRGIGVQNLNVDTVREFDIVIPSLNTQKKIVECLDKAQKLIDKRKEQIEALDELVKSKFIEMFGDPFLNPKGWNVSNYEDICTCITDGEHSTPKRCEEGIYLLSARNVLNHSLQLDDVDFIGEDEYTRISKRIIPEENDILISCSGSVGRVCKVPANIKFQMVRSVAILKLKDNINSTFMEWLIDSNYTQQQILKSINQSSQANLFQGKIKKLKAIVPPIELQSQFADFVNQVDKLKFEMEKSLHELENNFNALMQKAFSGQLF